MASDTEKRPRGNDPVRDNTQWTTDEDGAICKLKKDGKSWAEIGASISRKKSLVQSRFKYIKAQIEAAGCDTDSIGENWADDMRRLGKDIPSPQKPSPQKSSSSQVHSPRLPPVTEQPSPSRQSSPPKQTLPPWLSPPAGRVSPSKQSYRSLSSAPSTTAGKGSPSIFNLTGFDEHKREAGRAARQRLLARGGGGEARKQNRNKSASNPPVEGTTTDKFKLSGKIVKQNGKKFLELIESSSSSAEDGSSSSSDEEEEFDHEAERQAQKQFLYLEYWSELYPAQKTYQADKFWSKADCKTLAVIEAKDEALKFKRMQAEFFNATGRMLAEDIIKHKMQRGD